MEEVRSKWVWRSLIALLVKCLQSAVRLSTHHNSYVAGREVASLQILWLGRWIKICLQGKPWPFVEETIVLFRSSDNLIRPSLGPLKGSLSWHSALQGSSTSPLHFFTSRFSGMVMGWVGLLFLWFFWGRLAFGLTFWMFKFRSCSHGVLRWLWGCTSKTIETTRSSF